MKSAYPENFNSEQLVKLWADFIDWGKRRAGEGGFLIRTLKKHGCTKVLDGALGDGCDSIYLLKEGFDVTSNEFDEEFIRKALLNSKMQKVRLELTRLDWREMGENLPRASFDAVLVLGNSLTYLFSKKDQLRALANFRAILKKGGILIIDERNYDYILRNREEILKGDFKYSGRAVYCGKKVHARPILISDNKVKMRYEHENGSVGHLTMYPFKKGELRGLLKEGGFRVLEEYLDYGRGIRGNADFYTYVART
ncbi:MAG: class I SAM-dependent methyltransferase [Candidatus Micrarchaeota archaeon]